VTFELPSCVWADQISVSGSFNQWDERGIPLVQGHDGVWRATVDLAAGQRYEFRYWIDGRWQTDYHADGFTDNQYGSHNSVIGSGRERAGTVPRPVPYTLPHRPGVHGGSRRAHPDRPGTSSASGSHVERGAELRLSKSVSGGLFDLSPFSDRVRDPGFDR
jgi:hypothetical protein